MNANHALTHLLIRLISPLFLVPLLGMELQAQTSGRVPSFVKTLLEQQNRHSGEQPVPAPIPDPSAQKWKPAEAARDWKYIVLHHSATPQGSVASIHQAHLQRLDGQGKPWRGIAYHFVIGNGQGMQNGAVAATFRWEDQLEGAHAGDAHYNGQGIGICLIGNFDEHQPTDEQLQATRELVHYLSRHYGISAEQVIGHSDVKATQCPGKNFPDLQTLIKPKLLRRTASHNPNPNRLSDEDAPPPATLRR